MAQWVNRLRNNIFVNPPPLPLSCEISGALHLAQPGLTAGRQAGRPMLITIAIISQIVIVIFKLLFSTLQQIHCNRPNFEQQN